MSALEISGHPSGHPDPQDGQGSDRRATPPPDRKMRTTHETGALFAQRSATAATSPFEIPAEFANFSNSSSTFMWNGEMHVNTKLPAATSSSPSLQLGSEGLDGSKLGTQGKSRVRSHAVAHTPACAAPLALRRFLSGLAPSVAIKA